MRTVKVVYKDGVWFTSINLRLCDEKHDSTCYGKLSSTKLTSRQIRRLKKNAITFSNKSNRIHRFEQSGLDYESV